MADPVIMLAREKHRCDSGSESLDNTSHVTFCNAMLKDVIKVSEVSLLQKGQNDRIKNIVSVFYGNSMFLEQF